MFNFGGGMLTGYEIERQIEKGNIQIDPFDPKCINPNSYNLKLHPKLLIYKRNDPDDRHIDIEFGNKDDDYIDPCPIIDTSNIIVTSCLSGEISNTIDIPTIRSIGLDPIDMNKNNETVEFEIPDEGYVLQPGILYIGRTVERTFTDKFIPMINGRSSGGRLGISIHVCAGFGDIGFNGTWTLEITAVEPVRIYPNVEIAQVCYFKPYGKVKNLYNGRYLGQHDATASRFYKPKEY